MTLARTRVLVADDDRLSREYMGELLRGDGFEVVEAGDGLQAADQLEQQAFDLVLTDMQMPGLDGLELARRSQAAGGPPVVMFTGHGSLEKAVAAIRAGVRDLLLKPVRPEELKLALSRARGARFASRRATHVERSGGAAPDRLVGRSPALREVLERLRRAARSKATVLLEGESGTGKERLATLVHEHSPRAAGPFVKVNCAALAEGVLESELFGHERGAFTGALERRIGRFELAHGGTILLDEVSEISTSAQAKLLRVLEQEELERVGGSRTLAIDVRVVATTNRDLRREISRGTFREDLYYRLAVMPVRVPPLRERQGDVELLVEHFLDLYRPETNSRVAGFSAAALGLLTRHSWPGNVRELENVVRRVLALLNPGETVEPRHLQLYLSPGGASAPHSKRTIRDLERQAIEGALASTGGNRERTARVLGISVRTLYNRLKHYERAGRAIDVAGLGREAA